MKKTVCILHILFLAGCNLGELDRNTGLEESLFSVVENENNSEITVKPLADFKWDKAFLFEPYTPQDQIGEQLGVDFEDPSNISSRDDIYLLVFLNDKKVVQYAEVKRQKSGFSIGGKDYLTPSDDLIKIERY
ncbi:hypothetical protein U9J35_03445 [Rossellomorea aquimaris]|nr:hypothetical protein [Rossellomorea aquimaris]WRP07234.1 hypothetical protein U9J35_03445 [Rossellomorea aquimaris]